MRIILDVTPDEMRTLLAMRDRIEGRAWRAVSGIAGSERDSIGGVPARYRLVDEGASADAPGGIVAGFASQEDAVIAEYMHAILRRAIFEQEAG